MVIMSYPDDEMECPAALGAPLSPVIELPPEFPEDEETTSLLPCSICNRTFAPTALERHSKICEKLQAKKRNKFDSTKQRQEGLDIPPLGLSVKEKAKKVKSRWREKHQEFLQTIRAAKGGPEDGTDGEEGPKRLIPSDYVQCPFCERYFGPKAADRHIDWCGEQKSRLPRSHTSEDTEAIQRLKTRTKYTPPKPGQSGWRAPKKKDVISSIPPANTGPNITPPGRLISPPPPLHRQISPPPAVRPHNANRHFSPPPVSPPRKSSSSLPPGPHRHSTASLGRSAGRQFSSMLQSVTGCSPGYGVSTGYGSHSLYGSSPGHGHSGHPTHISHSSHPTFNRSVSLRLPRRRSSAAQGRMARHRDLASDMLASVTLGGKAKREEPEGDEASNMTPFYDRSPSNETEKASMTETQDEHSTYPAQRMIRSNTFDVSSNPDSFRDILNTSEEDISEEIVKSKRKALESEILKLTNQLRNVEFNCNNDIHSRSKNNTKLVNGPSNQDLGDELNFHLSDTDEDELDNIEEGFLKSSASPSGDDDVVEMGPSRPRSVHFEDEYIESGYFEPDEFNKSSSEGSTAQSWSAGSQRSQRICSQNEHREPLNTKSDIFLFIPRPINSKKSKPSVREILRQRREMVDYSERDSRRRVRSLDERNDIKTRSRSGSRDSKSQTRQKECQKNGVLNMKKSASTGNCSENYVTQRQINLPISGSGGTGWRFNENANDVAVISKRDYAHFRSLVGNKNSKDSIIRNKKGPILKPKRSNVPTRTNSSNKQIRLDNAPYDPFSAAELQFQDLLGPTKPGGGLSSNMMGSTSSLKHFGRLNRFSPDRDMFHIHSKPRSTSLMGGGSLSLCSLGLDTFDFNSCIRSPPRDDSSELESLENSPRDLRSPDDGTDDVVSRFSSSRMNEPFRSDISNQNFHSNKPYGSGFTHSDSKYHSRSPSVSSQRSYIEDSNKRKHPEGSNSFQKSPSPSSLSPFRFDSERKDFIKHRSPSPEVLRRPSQGFQKRQNDTENNIASYNSGWTNHSDLLGSPKTYSRYFGGKGQRDISSDVNSDAYTSAFESIKALRETLGEGKKSRESIEDNHQRVSSSSSTDSSAPALSSSSPPLSTSPIRSKEKHILAQTSTLPSFCYECGNKYPVNAAKFCCHCGARRLVVQAN